jgi:hypothetical protein
MCAADLVVVMHLRWPLLAAIFELILHCLVFVVLILPLFALLWQLVTSTWWLCYFWDWWYMLELIEWPMMHNIICWGGYLFFWTVTCFFPMLWCHCTHETHPCPATTPSTLCWWQSIDVTMDIMATMALFLHLIWVFSDFLFDSSHQWYKYHDNHYIKLRPNSFLNLPMMLLLISKLR